MCSFTFTMIWNDLGATSFRMACVSVWGAVGAWGVPGVLHSWFRPRYLHRKTVTRRLSRKRQTTVPAADGLQKQCPIVCPCQEAIQMEKPTSNQHLQGPMLVLRSTQLPRFVVEKWRQPACSVVRSTAQEGCCINLTLGWFQTYTLALVTWVTYSIGRRRDFPKECFGHSLRYPCLNFLLFPI